MKPGVSVASTGVLFQRDMSANEALAATASPPSHGTTSTSGITGAGLKKWSPMTRYDASHAAAIDATESDEVFVASTASRSTTSSSALNNERLAARSST